MVGFEDLTVVNFAAHHSPEALALELPPILQHMKRHPALGRHLYFKDTPPQHFGTPFGVSSD